MVMIIFWSTFQKWLISSSIGQTTVNIGISSSQYCVEDHTSVNTNWHIYTGDVNVQINNLL